MLRKTINYKASKTIKYKVNNINYIKEKIKKTAITRGLRK